MPEERLQSPKTFRQLPTSPSRPRSEQSTFAPAEIRRTAFGIAHRPGAWQLMGGMRIGSLCSAPGDFHALDLAIKLLDHEIHQIAGCPARISLHSAAFRHLPANPQ